MAMRPLESLDLEDDRKKGRLERLENAGPLAGLVGALIAEPDIIPSIKPPSYSSTLRASEPQKIQARLLSQLIAAESEAVLLPHSAHIRPQKYGRIVIALLLFATAVISTVFNIPAVSPPAISAEVFVAKKLVDDLPVNTPVLVAVDYLPGFSAELENGLGTVLDHLISKGHFLTFVSTSPTGPLLAERLVEGLQSRSSSSVLLEYANLGFIAGGPMGILAFAEDPRSSLSNEFQARQVWENKALLNVESIADFSLVVVAAENPETSRAWIEQAQPQMGESRFDYHCQRPKRTCRPPLLYRTIEAGRWSCQWAIRCCGV